VNDKIRYFATNGPAWTPDGPPYDNSDPGRPKPEPASERCVDQRSGAVAHPSWSPDSSALAFDDPQGIWVASVPVSLADCAQIGDRLLVSGASSPSWGPVDVNMAQAPGGPAPGGPGSSQGSGSSQGPGPAAHGSLSALAVKLSTRKRPTFEFTLSAPGTVALLLQRRLSGHRAHGRCHAGAGRGRSCTIARLVRSLSLAGRAGRNRIPLALTLVRGSYALRVIAPTSTLLTFKVAR
jgi:hypothetical protein